jgi:hypothetical protein
MKGSKCVRWKRTSAGKRCAVFGRKPRKRSAGVSGIVSECQKYKRVRIKHGKKRGQYAMRCARFLTGPGYPSVEYRQRAGVKNPDPVDWLRARETMARVIRIRKNIRHYRPREAA